MFVMDESFYGDLSTTRQKYSVPRSPKEQTIMKAYQIAMRAWYSNLLSWSDSIQLKRQETLKVTTSDIQS